jgi:ribosomal protein S18 acetylase RimI-like enzyme
MIRIRSLTHDDIPWAMRLKDQAGWNQIEADWRRFLVMEPEGCFVAEWDGQAAGTTVACILGSVAWIAMVLVDQKWRGRGIGKALMSHALDFLVRQSVGSVRLDATALGKPLYEKLGFVVEYELARYEGIPQGGTETRAAEKASEQDWPQLFQFDGDITGADRTKFLNRLFSEQPEAVRMVHSGIKVVGLVAARPGTRAWQIGPCLATHEAGAKLLAEAANRQAGERVFIDIPVQNQAAVHIAQELGLTVQRQLVRMCRGKPVNERTDFIWASSGPELG